jgi:hypothetical protein
VRCPTDGARLISRSQRGQSGALTKAMPQPSQIGAQVAVLVITGEPRPPLMSGPGYSRNPPDRTGLA